MSTKAIVWISIILFSLAVIGNAIGGQSITGTLEVGSSGSTIITVLGCMERFLCEGEGTDINWRFFGTRIDLTNTSTRQITIRRDEDNRMVSSHLTFTEVQLDHGDTYTCNIIDSVSRTTITLSARLTVNNTRVYIEPIENIDISSNTIGDTISVGCHIQTCEPQLTASILQGNNKILERPIMDRNSVLVNLDLTVSESTVGMYECLVMLPDGGDVFSRRFNITGTPLPLPTTVPPTNGGGNTNQPGSNNNNNGNSATSLYNGMTHLPLLCIIILLSVYLTNVKL